MEISTEVVSAFKLPAPPATVEAGLIDTAVRKVKLAYHAKKYAKYAKRASKAEAGHIKRMSSKLSTTDMHHMMNGDHKKMSSEGQRHVQRSQNKLNKNKSVVKTHVHLNHMINLHSRIAGTKATDVKSQKKAALLQHANNHAARIHKHLDNASVSKHADGTERRNLKDQKKFQVATMKGSAKEGKAIEKQIGKHHMVPVGHSSGINKPAKAVKTVASPGATP